MDFSSIFAILIAILVVLLTFWIRRIKKFAQKGFKFEYPLPLFGNNLKFSINRKHLYEVLDKIYRKFPNERCVMYFNFNEPYILIRDPDLICQVTLKHFDHFVNHHTFFDEELDPLIAYGLFQMKGERWKDMRTSLTPAFTVSRMKEMLPFIKDCAASLVSHINENIEKGNGVYEAEAKSLMMKCTNDTIASCAFGIVTDSLKNPDNHFYKMAEETTQIKPKAVFRMVLIMVFPKLTKFLGFGFTRNSVASYYRNIVKQIITNRQETGSVRRDMIHLLMLAKKGKLQDSQDAEECQDLTNFYDKVVSQRGFKQHWKDDEITAQVMSFLFAGLETTATALSFLLYELAVNEDWQKKLQDEIDEYVENNGKDIDHADMNKLKYLDMVLSETLRLWAPAGITNRVCTKDFDLPSTGDISKPTKIYRDDVIVIPVYSLHRDPKYWKNPLKFDPERFSKENKSKIIPYTYVPFGTGPRSCMGNRFVLMECKMFVFQILMNFDLITIPKTDIPLPIKIHMFAMASKNGTWIGFKKRFK